MFWSLTLVLYGNNPRFPWKPSATILTHRLTGTTEFPAANRDEHSQSDPAYDPLTRTTPRLHLCAQSSRTTVRPPRRALGC